MYRQRLPTADVHVFSSAMSSTGDVKQYWTSKDKDTNNMKTNT